MTERVSAERWSQIHRRVLHAETALDTPSNQPDRRRVPDNDILDLLADHETLRAELEHMKLISVRMDGPWVRRVVEAALRAGHEIALRPGINLETVEQAAARVLAEHDAERGQK